MGTVSFRKPRDMVMMKSFVVLLLVGMTMGAPQLDQLKDLLASLSGSEETESSGEVGDYESLPYTTIQKSPQGYEERLYPSMKFACAELTYPMEVQEEGEGGEEWGLISMIKKMTTGRDGKRNPLQRCS